MKIYPRQKSKFEIKRKPTTIKSKFNDQRSKIKKKRIKLQKSKIKNQKFPNYWAKGNVWIKLLGLD